jgi:hypothetical protein
MWVREITVTRHPGEASAAFGAIQGQAEDVRF